MCQRQWNESVVPVEPSVAGGGREFSSVQAWGVIDAGKYQETSKEKKGKWL
jgi:hypothetical protein